MASLGGSVAGLCGRCGRRPQQWGDVLCGPCGDVALAWLRRRRLLDAAARWGGAFLLEGLVGVGAGALALWAASLGGGAGAAGLLAVAALLAALLALAVFLAGCWLLRPMIRAWGLWAAGDAGEVLVSFGIVTTATVLAGYVPGVLAVAGVLGGGLAALLQGRALAAQSRRGPFWAAGSTLIWLVAGAAGLVVELQLPGSALGVLAGAGLGRLLYALLAGPLLAWTLMAPHRRSGHRGSD